MAENLNPEMLEKRTEEIFEALDTTKAGKIDKENLIEAVFELIEAIGFTDETEEGHNKLTEVCNITMKALEIDGNTTFDYEEYKNVGFTMIM